MIFRLSQVATITLLLSWILLSSHSFQPPLSHHRQHTHIIPTTAVKPFSWKLHAAPQSEQPIRRHVRLWRWCQRKAGPWAVAVALATARSQPAQARYSHELVDQPTHSLRPGMTKTQAELLEEGAIDASEIEAKVFVPDTSSPATKASKQSFEYGDLDDDDDDDDAVLLETTPTRPVTQAEKIAAGKLQTKRQFAAYHQTKTTGLTLKIGLAFFVPTYGSLIAREWYRRRREEAYVKKGLEIMEAQKAEYFNITSDTQDSDVSDELKKLKKTNETKSEDDDEDDDDDDEEEDQPLRRRRDPRKPSGDGGGSPSSSGGGGDGNDDKKDPGYGKPSDEDLDRLNKIFGKS